MLVRLLARHLPGFDPGLDQRVIAGQRFELSRAEAVRPRIAHMGHIHRALVEPNRYAGRTRSFVERCITADTVHRRGASLDRLTEPDSSRLKRIRSGERPLNRLDGSVTSLAPTDMSTHAVAHDGEEASANRRHAVRVLVDLLVRLATGIRHGGTRDAQFSH